MAPIGALTQASLAPRALGPARAGASALPDLLVEARRIAANVTAGWHGRRRRGSGENFWQFRPFVEGEPVSRIDWRRSARDEHVYLRDREWEAAQTVWLWADPSPSMLYRSTTARDSKENRALVLVLALAELLSRSGERIGCPGVTEPVSARNGAERLAAALLAQPAPAFPPSDRIRRFSQIVLVSDFLDPIEETISRLDRLAGAGANGHLVQVFDPAEESFPYSGRTEFRDPETGATLTAGRAEALRAEYERLYAAHRQSLAEHCRRIGWSFTAHRTDRLASDALIAVHSRLSGAPLSAGGRS